MTDSTFDLGTNTSVPLTAVATDAAGNDATGPIVFSGDGNVGITDNGDGTALATRNDAGATTATITATVTNPDGTTVTGTLTISIAAQVAPSGNAVDVQIIPGTPIA